MRKYPAFILILRPYSINVVGRQRDCGWIISFHDLVVARIDEILPFIFEIICESDDGCASVGMVPYLVMFSVIHTERKRLLRKCLEGSIYDTTIRETLLLWPCSVAG